MLLSCSVAHTFAFAPSLVELNGRETEGRFSVCTWHQALAPAPVSEWNCIL